MEILNSFMEKDISGMRNYFTGKPFLDNQLVFDDAFNHVSSDVWGDTLKILKEKNVDIIVRRIVEIENSELTHSGKVWLLALLYYYAPTRAIEALLSNCGEKAHSELEEKLTYCSKNILSALLEERKMKEKKSDEIEERELEKLRRELLNWEFKARKAKDDLERHG